MHLQDLPRPRRDRRSPTPDNSRRGPATAVADPPAGLQPVDLDHSQSTGTPSENGIRYDAKAREAELIALNAAPPPSRSTTLPPSSKVEARPEAAPSPAADSRPGLADAATSAPSRIPETTQPARPRLAPLPPVEGVKPPSGTARLSGRSLQFPLGAKLTPGEQVVLGGRTYEIRHGHTFTAAFWLKGAALVVLVILAAVGITHMAAGPQGGSITGVVVDRLTSRILPSATLRTADGRQVTTNIAGLYSFDGLTPGQYQLTASAEGYESQTGTVIRPARDNAQLAFALVPLVYDTGSAIAFATRPPAESSPTETEESAPVAYGNVNLNTDFEDYLIFVDDVLYGKNAKKLKRMSAGDHKIVLQLDGYEDYSTSVAVKARSTSTLTVSKSDLVPKVNPLKRAKGHFAEGKSLLDRGLWQAAIEAYDRGLEFDPENAGAIQYRGWAYFKAGNMEKARVDFLAAAQLHRNASRYLDAVACAGHLIDMDPTNPDSYRRRAGFYIALTEYGKAIDDYEQAVKLDKKSFASQLGLGEACFLAGDYRRAAKEFDKARKLADDPFDVYVRLLVSLSRAGEDDQVRKKYKEFSGNAAPERLQKLRNDPEWLRVLQIVDPTVRSQG
ncbi:MAG: carboxypeptidase regulatory-like domain-containing protein [Candidatus Zixiibacteriota bacterium]